MAIALYVAGAVIMQRHAVGHLGSVIAGNLIGDPTQYMWSMWWWPHALLHGLNPFVTHAIWVPNAYNLGSVTSTPLPSLLFAPVTALVGPVQGPVVSYNLCNLIAPVLGAWFAYRLCLYLSRAPAASIVGGWLYGFSAYGLSQLQGHLNLVFTFLPVVLALLSVQRFDGVIGRRRFVVLAALALAAQILIGTEIVFTTTCMLLVTLLAGVTLAPRQVRGRIAALAPELFAAYAVAAIVCAPFLYYALTGPEIEANVASLTRVADVLSFVVPTPLMRIGAHRFEAVSGGFPPGAGYGETGTYLGVPLVLGALAWGFGSWDRWKVRLLIVVTAVGLIWSLGPDLYIDGHATIPLPWKLLAHQSPFNEVTPVRIGMYVALGTAIAFALWLARRPARQSKLRWLLALGAVAFLFPNVDGRYPTRQRIFQENISSPAFIADGLYRSYLPRDTVILPIPFGPFGNSMLWQAQAQGYFRLASGWFGYWPPGYATNRVISELSGFTPFTDPVTGMRSFLSAHRVGGVVIVDGQGGPWPRVMSQLGLSPVPVGGVELYRVPRGVGRP